MKTTQFRPISYSSLKEFKKSPRHYLHYLQERKESTQAQIISKALHVYFQEKEEGFLNSYAILNDLERPEPEKDYRNASNRDWKNSLIQEAQEANKEIITKEDFETFKEIYNSAIKNPVSRGLVLFPGEHEKKLSWKVYDEEMVGYIDKYIDDSDTILDYKFLDDANPQKFIRELQYTSGYLQASMYVDAIKEETGNTPDFYYILAEKKAPFNVSVVRMTPEYLEAGIVEYRNLVSMLKECKKHNAWGGYEVWAPFSNEGVYDAEIPYALNI